MKKIIAMLLCVLLLCACSAPAGDATPAICADAMQQQTINYYFMTGEGKIIDTEGEYKTKWGDSCLVVFPNGKTMLIDVGMKNFYPVLKAKLESYGIKKLDYVVFSHPHNDHCGGIWAGFLNDFTIGQVYHNGQKNPSWDRNGNGKHIEDYCKEANIPCQVLGAGDELSFGDVSMKVLWPTKEAIDAYGPIEGSAALNCLSLVMRFDYGEHSSLFTGDLYKTYNGLNGKESEEPQVPGQIGAEEQLVALYPNGELDVDLLKLPHHGDPSTSNSEAFFAATTPQMAMATAFTPVGNYLKQYKKRGYTNATFFDRQYGYIHFSATIDGKLKADPERMEYLPDFGGSWNKDLERN